MAFLIKSIPDLPGFFYLASTAWNEFINGRSLRSMQYKSIYSVNNST